MIPCLVISLRRSHERRSRITARLNALGVPFTFFDALEGDGRATYSRRYGRALSQGEIGCYLSHVAAARVIATSDEPFGCILEDDAVLQHNAAHFLSAEILSTLPPFDILRLEALFHGRNKHVTTIQGVKVCAPLYPDAGAAAQIYTRSGAAKIASCRRPISEPIDVHLYYDPPIRPLRLLDVSPACASRDHVASEIGERHDVARFGWYDKTCYKLRRRMNYHLAWSF